jgi:hypothetical protein
MKEYVAKYIILCILFCTSPSNMKQGIHHRLLVPTQPCESISMDFVGGLLIHI